MIGSSVVGDQNRQTYIGFRNITDCEQYINAIDGGGYDSEEAIFNGFIYIYVYIYIYIYMCVCV